MCRRAFCSRTKDCTCPCTLPSRSIRVSASSERAGAGSPGYEPDGADPKDLVPFEKYAAAAQGLASPSSAARALFGGAPNIERVDRLVQAVGARKGMRNAVIDEVVTLVDARLELNRRATQAGVSQSARKTA